MSLFRHNCKKQGHKFEARYDYKYDYKFPDLMEGVTRVSGYRIEDVKEKVYICDICIYCGKTIYRK